MPRRNRDKQLSSTSHDKAVETEPDFSSLLWGPSPAWATKSHRVVDSGDRNKQLEHMPLCKICTFPDVLSSALLGRRNRSLLHPRHTSTWYCSTSRNGVPPLGETTSGEGGAGGGERKGREKEKVELCVGLGCGVSLCKMQSCGGAPACDLGDLGAIPCSTTDSLCYLR